jgi:hypothetical protein
MHSDMTSPDKGINLLLQRQMFHGVFDDMGTSSCQGSSGPDPWPPQ